MSFEFSPHKLVYGGDALGHYQGQAVFVPRALPGERIEAEEIRTAKGVMHARPLRILDAAAERVDPPCPYFGNCGGCQYQLLKAEDQTAAKREILRETLRRIGKIVWESDIPGHVAHPWNYRNQAQFKVACQPDGQIALGFFEAESHRFIPIDACLILSPLLNAILAELRQPGWGGRLTGCREIELLADDRDERVMVTLRGNLSRNDVEALAKDLRARLAGVVCVAIESDGGLQVFGEPSIRYRVDDFDYRVSPGSFFQASRFLIQELVAAATTGEQGLLALDLFAGVGLLTLPLARQFDQVMGVEANELAAADLAENAEANGLPNVRVVAQTAFDFLRRFARAEPDLVVLDPPRAGVGPDTLKLIAALRPKRIHYVSCHPPTLARDLGLFIAQGFAVSSIEMFDFFPQTFHIESVVKLVRKEV
jgi:23S rRNA (uracil1939-C5)-methyltransferase